MGCYGLHLHIRDPHVLVSPSEACGRSVRIDVDTDYPDRCDLPRAVTDPTEECLLADPGDKIGRQHIPRLSRRLVTTVDQLKKPGQPSKCRRVADRSEERRVGKECRGGGWRGDES